MYQHKDPPPPPCRTQQHGHTVRTQCPLPIQQYHRNTVAIHVSSNTGTKQQSSSLLNSSTDSIRYEVTARETQLDWCSSSNPAAFQHDFLYILEKKKTYDESESHLRILDRLVDRKDKACRLRRRPERVSLVDRRLPHA